MNKFAVEVNGNEQEIREAYNLLISMGYSTYTSDSLYTWITRKAYYLNVGHEFEVKGFIGWYGKSSIVDMKIISLPQLRDLVVLHRNDVSDANWVTEGDDQIYEDSNGKSFIFREQGWDELQRHEMRQAMWEKIKPKPQPTEHEQGLISGADAKLAWAKGENVQISFNKKEWKDIVSNDRLLQFEQPCGFYRIKPRTIKLELEIPACGKNYKHGQLIWVLNSLEPKEYCSVILDESDELPAYWWETEEEIKQVVAALRGGIKG